MDASLDPGDLVLKALLLDEDPKQEQPPLPPPRTLLPSSVASVVSLVTATSSLSLRVGGFLGGAAINVARAGTLTSFELGRVIFEGILTRAGQDVASTSRGDTGKIFVEALLLNSVCSSCSHVKFVGPTTDYESCPLFTAPSPLPLSSYQPAFRLGPRVFPPALLPRSSSSPPLMPFLETHRHRGLLQRL